MIELLEEVNDLIVYKDNHIIVATKPSGITTVPPKKADHKSLEELLIDLITQQTGYPPKFIAACNRLDRDTSGLVLFALRKSVAANLNKQFEERKVKKIYYALCESMDQSNPPKIKDKGVIEGWLVEEEKLRYRLVPYSTKKINTDMTKGKKSKTRYEVVEKNGNRLLVKLSPLTGRTHQLRVHMKSLGYPICGDVFYGRSESSEVLCLHAYELEFFHPSLDKGMKVTTSIPSWV